MPTKPKKPTHPYRAASDGSVYGELYQPGDPLPVPEATEKNTETTWALWSDLQANEQRRYADTVPLTRPGALPSSQSGVGQPGHKIMPAAPASRSLVEKVLLEAKRGNRVCPRPAQWQQLYEMLASSADASSAARLGDPLIGEAWKQTTSLAKRLVFKDHVEWAAAHGQINELFAFIKALPEDQWHHMGD